eukprot:2236762-Amphidinium_carterae.1
MVSDAPPSAFWQLLILTPQHTAVEPLSLRQGTAAPHLSIDKTRRQPREVQSTAQLIPWKTPYPPPSRNPTPQTKRAIHLATASASEASSPKTCPLPKVVIRGC